jgi:hypothetical protein
VSARAKPLVSWSPFWYLTFFAALLVTSALQQSATPVFLTAVVITALFALALVVGLVVTGRRPPGQRDADGLLRSLDGVRTVESLGTGSQTVVADTTRHQGSIAAALALGDNATTAIIVPRATRWLGRRYRVAVQLAAGTRLFHAGFLNDEAQANWDRRLTAAAADGCFLSVPAIVVGSSRPLAVSVDLGGIDDTLGRIANDQKTSS